MPNTQLAIPETELSPALLAKETRLREWFRQAESVLVAFSGGVDSSYVALIATQELGSRARCVTGDSASLSQIQRQQCKDLAQRFGWHHEFIQTSELLNPSYAANPSNRCFYCKSELYGHLVPLAATWELSRVVDGSTVDDMGDYRPGRQAAAAADIASPLIEAELSKAELRVLSRRAGLPTWDAPASPCLASRVAYGTPVTISRLRTVETGESILRELGFREFRVRHHDELVRLEVAPTELDKVLNREIVDELAHRFRKLGFRYVTLDLHGFRSGAMNEVL